ncbi:hypothetical protein CDAR_448271 [Caerostris darwini]|uniref:Uncharacterized protein n=1 Tax=Caerostris darwini TaxID=1538125 RepID=A0AAV4SHU4_9ARAC|nr:hypothetical protein CDAR_448271 [Caerostris darwini]
MAQLGASVLKSQLDPSPTRQKLFTSVEVGASTPSPGKISRSISEGPVSTHASVRSFRTQVVERQPMGAWVTWATPLHPTSNPFVPGASTGGCFIARQNATHSFLGKEESRKSAKVASPEIEVKDLDKAELIEQKLEKQFQLIPISDPADENMGMQIINNLSQNNSDDIIPLASPSEIVQIGASSKTRKLSRPLALIPYPIKF